MYVMDMQDMSERSAKSQLTVTAMQRAAHYLDRLMSSEVQGFVNPGTEAANITNTAKEGIEKVTKRPY